MVVVCGPVVRDVRRVRPVSDRPWPGGAKRTPYPPGQRPSVAPRRKTYAVPARPAAVRGPAARDVRRVRATGGRWWPGGARRTPCTRKWWSSLARRRETTQHPESRVHLWPGGASRTGDRRSHHPNPHFAPTGSTSHLAYLVRSRRKWCAVRDGGAGARVSGLGWGVLGVARRRPAGRLPRRPGR